MKYDVFGLGNPLIDVSMKVDDAFVAELGLQKGTMNLVNSDRQLEILIKCENIEKITTLGGSCANSMVMISQLGGKSAFGGKVGKDNLADDYESQLINAGVDSYLIRQEGMTGSTVILVNPDAERTMNTNLGMSQEFAREDLNASVIEASEYIYVEGYLWDTEIQKQTVMSALEIAKKNNTKIALTLSDTTCVESHRDDFQRLIDEYVDILFCNETEAGLMTQKDHPEDQIAVFSKTIDHIVLTLGGKGSKIFATGDIITIPVFETTPVDTTGAGDSYAAGYLYAITHDYSPEKAGILASYCASTIVSQTGPRYDGDFRALVSKYLQ